MFKSDRCTARTQETVSSVCPLVTDHTSAGHNNVLTLTSDIAIFNYTLYNNNVTTDIHIKKYYRSERNRKKRTK